MDKKNNAAELGWRVDSSSTRFDCEVFRITEDELEIGNRRQIYAYVERPAAVVIVPLTRDGQIITVRQYRYPIDEWCVEVPAGGTHDTGDESLLKVARDELREEVGGTAETFTHVGSFYTSPSLTTEKVHVYLAENVRLTKEAKTETTEEIKIEIRPADQVVQLTRRGEMKNAPCALAVLLCEPLLKSRGYLK